MPKVKVPNMLVKYDGLFDFDGLYATIIDWAKNYGYMWHEKDYKHKVPSPEGAEQEFVWVLNKKVTDWLSYTMVFTVYIWDMLEVEVEVEGKKKSLSNARIRILLEGSFEYDRQKKFKGSRFNTWLGKVYPKIYEREISDIFDRVNYRMMNIQSIIKTYFDMQSKKYVYKGYLQEN